MRMEVALQNVRELSDFNTRVEVLDFLKQTTHLPGNAVVVFDEKDVSLLVDDDDQLLGFR